MLGFHLALLISISILSQFFGPTQDPELGIRTQKEAARTMHCYHTYVEPHEANIEPNDTKLKRPPVTMREGYSLDKMQGNEQKQLTL